MWPIARIKSAIIIFMIVFSLFGCGNNDFDSLKSEYNILAIEVVGNLNQNDLYNSVNELQKSGKLEEMKELLDKMNNKIPYSKKDEYEASKLTYESISEIATKAMNWDKLTRGEKTELQLKVTLEKALIDENKQ